MPELSLDDVDRHPFPSQFDSVRVSQLVGRKPPPDSGFDRELAELATRCCG